ncbi:ATP-dependent RNA helicase HrpA [Bifidobacteriaceae bacterium NR044]|nr:ATP-dependent RNA helicase HrpA [Bifidobacteriaceae bacterium NR043]MBF9353181.1 ATP-dependent RNA helicase HrpA [Bifidobacteriaceae bacterium NR044]RFT41009.1 ATP-dependent RNA helicase HrpA [Bifidobacteriaceae bacterium NR003]
MKFDYPTELPICAAHDEIIEAIKSSQVVIVSGQTGSGKTTQIPKMALELGRGGRGKQIVHTQPRRLAARTVAERIASEMGVKLGEEIGYQVRFTDESSTKTKLRIVTDGILLAQIQRDPLLTRYDTIIIDEAHERSLNIDFLLGYLTTLLPKRQDLKLIITSATIDSAKFRNHFEEALHIKVPVIEVSGRTYPVKVLYEPLGSAPSLMKHVPGFADITMDEETVAESQSSESNRDDIADEDMTSAVTRACAQLVIHSSHDRGARDIMVFASGERDIREFEDGLRSYFGTRASDMKRADAIEIVPLFARLSAKDQHRVFESHSHQRIVIATNVAETSLTVPGIRYVVDPGFARISRYSKSAKVQRLPIEPISQASADQRSGRCGRIADGIAIRLYSREDYETRPRFTDPEILRTSLGAVVLHMLSVGVAKTGEDITNFGFIDPPDIKAVSDGFNELTELGAISRKSGVITLTKVGRELSKLPIDIRLGRMIVEAARKTTPNTLAAVLVIVAFLSLQDPRERPEEQREEADRLHNRYADETSDFLTALNMWDRLFQADGDMSNNALRRICKAEFFHFLRLKQWKDLVNQLQDLCKELHYKVGDPTPVRRPSLEIRQLPNNQQASHSLCCSWDSQGIHSSMLAGLLSMMGMQVVREPKASDFAGLSGTAKIRAMKRAQKMSKNDYQGSRGTRFAIFPASAVSKTTPSWIICTELVETSRLWARYCAQIDPAWAEPLAKNLTRVTYSDAHWSASKGAAVAKSKVLLYGLPIVKDRTVQWARVNPYEARMIMIRQGLVEGDIQQRFQHDEFILNNRNVLDDADNQANRTRQISETVNDEDLFTFYDTRIPQEATTIATLAKWWKDNWEENPNMLNFDPDEVERLQTTQSTDLADYPDHWNTVGTDGQPFRLRLSYIYDPSNPLDGVTVHVPLYALSRLTSEEFTWNVPGLLDELIIGMIKSLPKSLRVQFVPAPNTAQKIRSWIDEHYDTLPGIEETNKDTNGLSWPDFREVFTKAAIAVIGAQIHPEVFNDEQIGRLSPYLRVTFSVEERKTNANRNKAAVKNNYANRVKPTILGTDKSLIALQKRFAKEAQESARAVVNRKASKAAQAGNVVERADLLHKSGATNISRSQMVWQGALNMLHLDNKRITSRWLGSEALLLAAAPYSTSKDLAEDLQMAAVKRLIPNTDNITDDNLLRETVANISEIYEDTVYDVAHDVIAILKRDAEVSKAVSGKADLPMLSVLQSIREHVASLVYEGFIAKTPSDSLPRIEKYLHADVIRLNKAKSDKNRDVRWAWEAEEAHKIVEKAKDKAKSLPLGPSHDEAENIAERLRWMCEEFYVSLWAQELGTANPISIQRMRKMDA